MKGALSSIGCAVWIAASLPAQILQEDFNGTVLGPAWEAFPNGGAISVSGGMLHLSNLSGYFPYVRIIPGIAPVVPQAWTVETRMRWPTVGGCGTKFASSHNPVGNLVSCTNEPWLSESPILMNRDAGAASGTHVKAGDTLMSIGLTDTALHTFRWESDGTLVSFFLDGAFVFAGNHDGHQPNNFWIGNPCPIGCGGWSTIEVDKIRFEGGPFVLAPALASIGSAINYALSLEPLKPYVLDVSVSGTFPGVTVNPGNVHVPLNPPYLNFELGALLPGIFVNFVGFSDAAGSASATVNLPIAPPIIGLNLSACFIVLDPVAPSGIGAVAGPVTTTITYVPTLLLTQVSPLAAPPGAIILVTGSGIQAGATVTVGGLGVQILSLTATSITFTNPPNPQCDTVISVLNPDGQLAITPFSPAPTITGVLNGSGPAAGGSSFGIDGSQFLPGTTVTVGGAAATITYQSPAFLICTAPPGAPGPAAIVVSSAGSCTASSTFVYQ